MIPRIKWLPAWLESRAKWQEIVWRTERGEKFASNRGFKKLSVLGPCGYCETFSEFCETFNGQFSLASLVASCRKCPLFRQGVCRNELQGLPTTPFWEYIHWMRVRKNKLALPYALAVLKAIEEEP